MFSGKIEIKLYFILPAILIFIFLIKFLINQNYNSKSNLSLRTEGIVAKNPNRIKNFYQIKLGKINVELSKSQAKKIHQGDYVELTGRLERRVIWGFYKQNWLIYPELIKVSNNISLNNNNYKYYLLQIFYKKIKNLNYLITGHFRKLFPENEASLLAGMILGTKDLFNRQNYTYLKDSGLIHLAVASGTNVAFLFIFSLGFISWFSVPRSLKFLFIELILLIYTILAGFDPPIVRATIMLSLIYFSKMQGRKTHILWILGNTALLMLCFNVDMLVSLSFYMSIIATYAVVYYSNQTSLLLEVVRRKLPLLNSLIIFLKSSEVSQILAVQLWLWPLLLLVFGKVNILAFFSNLAVGFVVPIIMSIGILLIFVSSISMYLGQVIAWFLLPMLSWINFIAKVSAEHALFINSKLSILVVSLWWIVLIALLSIKKMKYA